MPQLNTRHPGARREHILDAAEQCFGRAGFHRTTMHHLQGGGRQPRGALRLFDSKRR